MTHADIKREVLLLAGWLAPAEPMTADDLATPLPALVARVLSDPGTSHVRAAVIALTLAEVVEERSAP